MYITTQIANILKGKPQAEEYIANVEMRFLCLKRFKGKQKK